MLRQDENPKWQAVIGLEIHAQVSTLSKLFSSESNDAFHANPNDNISVVSMGFPGALPVLNAGVVEKAAKAALALRSKVALFSKFDRKNYFYPDLPMGYQISQYDEPLALGGHVDIFVEGEHKRVRLSRLHIENDAGKLTHVGNDTLLDFNRAGVPLMEIVSEPDMHNAKEARAYAQMVQNILRLVGSSDCDMEKGMMRFDASVSLRPLGDPNLYPRAEIKNLNSFRSLELAIDYEIQRQTLLWESGNPINEEETLGWNEDLESTYLLRKKESAADYRYFPEPDLPPIVLNEAQIEAWSSEIPELPYEIFTRFMLDYNMSETEARFYSEDKKLADYFEEIVRKNANVKAAQSFVGTILIKALKDANATLEEKAPSTDDMAELISMVDEGLISNNVAKTRVFEVMMSERISPKEIIEREGLAQVSDTGALEAICDEVIANSKAIVEDIKQGKTKAMGALVGLVMQKTQGKANPKIVNTILEKRLL